MTKQLILFLRELVRRQVAGGGGVLQFSQSGLQDDLTALSLTQPGRRLFTGRWLLCLPFVLTSRTAQPALE